MMKLAWGLIDRRDALWVQVMRAKHGCGEDAIPIVQLHASSSNAWRGISSVWEVFYRNLIWRIGNRENIRFWEDHWILGINKLTKFALVDLDEEDLKVNVN